MNREPFADSLEKLAKMFRDVPEMSQVSVSGVGINLLASVRDKRAFDSIACALDAQGYDFVVKREFAGELIESLDLGWPQSPGDEEARLTVYLQLSTFCKAVFEEEEVEIPEVGAVPKHKEVQRKLVGWKCGGELIP